MGGHLCVGPDGSSLLGFLSVVGAFSALSRAWPERNVRVRWTKERGWRPVLMADGPSSDDGLVDALNGELRRRKIGITDENGALADNTNKLTVGAFRAQAERLMLESSIKDRRDIDFLAAVAGEVAYKQYIADTALRTLSGAGHQDFLGTMRNLVEKVGKDDIAATLFKTWRATESRKLSLRYDPLEDRRYALRATNPSDNENPPVSFPGANRLAVEALECFPTYPGTTRLWTTGFVQKEILWPLWESPVSLASLRSLLLRKQIYDPRSRAEDMRSIGVSAVFTSTRISTGGDRFRNFTPAKLRV